jgi:uncharacterized protein
LIIAGTENFHAPPERVYTLFTDEQALARCTPGCEKLERTGPDQFTAVLKVGVANIKGTYTGKLELAEKEPPSGYVLKVEGSGAPGWVKGSARFRFEPDSAGTAVHYEWDVQVGGLVAGVGQRILGGVAKMMINQFHKDMKQVLEEGSA